MGGVTEVTKSIIKFLKYFSWFAIKLEPLLDALSLWGIINKLPYVVMLIYKKDYKNLTITNFILQIKINWITIVNKL